MGDAQANDGGQAALWNGPAGRNWVDAQALTDRVYEPFEHLLVDAVAAVSRGAVLDVGCGTGQTTAAVARRLGVDSRCTGIDISEPMIAAARARVERDGTPARFIRADAQDYAFEPASVDTIMSRFGVMFFDDPVRAFVNLRRAGTDDAALRVIVWRNAAREPVHDDGRARRGAAPAESPAAPSRRAGPVRVRRRRGGSAASWRRAAGRTSTSARSTSQCTFPESGPGPVSDAARPRRPAFCRRPTSGRARGSSTPSARPSIPTCTEPTSASPRPAGWSRLEGVDVARRPAVSRFGRRTARTLPLWPPPQKNRSAPSDSRPDTPTPGGISRLSRTSPVRGSMRRRSLASPSHVACQSSPSTQVTPVTKRFDSIVRRIAPVSGSIWWILRSRYCPHPQGAFGPRQPRVATAAWGRNRREHPARLRIDLVDAVLRDLEQVLAVERRAGMRGDVERAPRLSADRIEGLQRAAGREPHVLAVERHAVHAVDAREGTVLADDVGCRSAHASILVTRQRRGE